MAARLTIEHLRDIVWIAVADPAVGAVDDFSFATRHEVHGLQVKWSRHPGTITLHNLTSGHSPLLGELADGWQRLRDREPGLKAQVHLITNDIASKNDALRAGPAPRHTAAFVDESLRPTQQLLREGAETDDTADLRTPWQDAWQMLQRSTGLDGPAFWDFIGSLHLELNASLERPLATSAPESTTYGRDVDRLAGYLADVVSEPQQRVRLPIQTVLDELGWSRRGQYRNAHSFPVPTEYAENEPARHRLNRALAELSGGYVTLLGSPGSGKSTLLAAADFGDARVVHYFAYVPDVPVSPDRSESEAFLHDLTEQLHRAGLPTGPLGSAVDVATLKRRLASQLDHAHTEWKETGRDTIIIVDGLDHVARGPTPVRSMLYDLPMPDAIPDGVKLILGTQTTSVLPSGFEQQLAGCAQKIELQPLDADTVLAVAERAGVLRWLPASLQSQLVQASEGHPLALRYLLEELANAYEPDLEHAEQELEAAPPTWSSQRKLTQVLDDASSLGSDIESRYRRYWTAASEDDELQRLLAVACRLRGPLHLPWLREWNDVASVTRLVTTARHFFHRDGDTWFFFHASFRQFLQLRTAEVDGEFDADLDARHHRAIADAYAATAEQWPLLAADEIAHRFLSGDFDGTLTAAAPARLRARVRALDPIDAVADDVGHALRAAGATGDITLVARYALLQTELSLRRAVLEVDDLARALAEAGAADIAVRHLRAGRTLRVKPVVALEAVPHLLSAGRPDEAKRIAQLAGRLSLLVPPPAQHLSKDDVDRVQAWVTANYALASPEALQAQIDAVLNYEPNGDQAPATADDSPNSSDSRRLLRLHALDKLADCLLSDCRQPDERLLEEIAVLDKVWAARARLKAAHLAINQADRETARALADRVTTTVQADSEPVGQRLGVAELLVRLRGRIDDDIYGLVPSPVPITEPSLGEAGAEDAMRAAWPIYQRHRMQHLVGKGLASDQAIEGQNEPRRRGAVRFLRAVCELAELDAGRLAKLWLGKPIAAASPARIRQILSVFDVDPRAGRDWSGWYLAVAAAPRLLEMLVRVVADLPGGVDALVAELDRAWAPDSNTRWTPERRRAVLVALDRVGADRTWIEWHLEDNELPSSSDTPHELVAEALAQARAWHDLGGQQRATANLRAAVDRSLGPGLYDEDDQLVHWVTWMFTAIEQEQVNTVEGLTRIWRMAVRLPGVSAADEHQGSRATQQLIRCTWRLSAAHAAQLTRWADHNHLAEVPDLVKAVLDGAASDSSIPPRLVAHVMAQLYLPVGNDVPDAVSNMIARAGNGSPQAAAEVATIVAEGVARWALPTRRAAWIQAVHDALASCDAIDDLGAPSASTFGPVLDTSSDTGRTRYTNEWHTAGPSLVLQDGTELSTEDALARVTDSDTLLDLLRATRRQGDTDDVPPWRAFSWRPLLKQVVDELQEPSALQVLDGLADITADAETLELLRRRFHELGSRDGLVRTAQLIVERTSVSGWFRWYDGGLRAKAWKTLIDRGQPDARDEAMRDLADALATGSNRNMLPAELHSLLDVVADSVPTHEIWPDIDAYLDELAPVDASDSPWTEHDDLDTSRPSSLDLLRLVGEYLGHPLRVLDTAARRILSGALQDTQTARPALEVLLQHVAGGSWAGEAALTVLLSVAPGDVPTDPETEPLINQAVHSASSCRDQVVRDLAHACASRHGWPPPPIPPARPLNPRLLLELPLLGRRRPPSLDATGKPLTDPADTRQVIAPYDVVIEGVADAAELDASAAVHECAEVARRAIVGSSRWLLPDASALQAELSAAGLKHTYRPHALLIGRRAAAQLLADLVDSGRLPGRELAWSAQFLLTDQYLALAWPQPRPTGVLDVHLDRDDALRGARKDWMENLEVAADEYATATNERPRTLLAEEAEFILLEWESPREVRRLEVLPDDRPQGRLLTSDTAIASVPTRAPPQPFDDLDEVQTSRDYYERCKESLSEQPLRLVVRGTSWTADPLAGQSLAGQWLALEPRVGQRLGWQPSNEGLFRWVGPDGEIRVESIWWVQGLTSHQPPNFDVEVAEGWHVVISDAAKEELQSAFGSLVASMEFKRSLGKHALDPDESATTSREKPIS